jgi:tRNA pseudouridine38-40 synthase
MSKSKFLFKTFYVGRKQYYGSQKQKDFLTIEQCILNALLNRNYIHELKKSEIEFASRTDRFVSARGACFTCILEKEPVLMEINSALPKEIGIWAYAKVPLEFSSRHNAISRHYIYVVHNPISYLQNTTGLDINLMKKALKQLEGRHNFVNLAKKETDVLNTVRDMDSARLMIQDDHLIFQFKSRSFLRQQIRRIVKKVLELGKFEINYEDFLDLFDIKKTISYQPADPKGLILWDIIFKEKFDFIEDRKSKERMKSFFLKKEFDYNLKYHLFRILQQDDFS